MRCRSAAERSAQQNNVLFLQIRHASDKVVDKLSIVVDLLFRGPFRIVIDAIARILNCHQVDSQSCAHVVQHLI